MNDRAWPGTEAFRKKHAVSRSVWRARGYSRYRQGRAGIGDLVKIDEGYRAVPYDALERRTQVGGLAILRRALPHTEGPRPLAELRPDAAIRLHSKAKPAKYLFAPSQTIERLSLSAEVDTSRDFWDDLEAAQVVEAALAERLGGDPLGAWDRPALELALGRKIRPRSPHRRRDAPSEQSWRIRVDGQRLVVTSQLVKAKESEAGRIDAHPIALGLLDDARRIYVGLEGCLKADAMLSAILKARERATVLSVPSVTLWPRLGYHGGDLRRLAALGRDREVVLVCDADWADPDWSKTKNEGAVLAQSASFAHRLAQFGVERVAIAAPPVASRLKGVDDFLAAGGSLADLDVIAQRDVEPLLDRLREAHGPGEVAFETTARVGAALVVRSSMHDGTVSASSGRLVHDIGTAPLDRRDAAAPRDVAAGAARRHDAAKRAVRKTYTGLRAGGVTIEQPRAFVDDSGDHHVVPTRFILPVVDRPGVLGRLGDVGVPVYKMPDVALRAVCDECGEPIEGAVRASARLHPLCATRLRVREFKARRRAGNA